MRVQPALQPATFEGLWWTIPTEVTSPPSVYDRRNQWQVWWLTCEARAYLAAIATPGGGAQVVHGGSPGFKLEPNATGYAPGEAWRGRQGNKEGSPEGAQCLGESCGGNCKENMNI